MKKWNKFIFVNGMMAGIYILLNALAKKWTESSKIDDDNPYIKIIACNRNRNSTLYENKIKPILDRIFSFAGLVILAPVCILISIAIFIDDPGPIIFIQKRVGKDGNFIFIHKFRSMRSDAPSNIPTHQLTEPERYITRIGAFLRKTSLDEIPQIWDIFRGKMSVIGPRPALWNQEDLVAERERFGANSVFPGLTGLAQIKGRDELEISDKAELDGQYVAILRKGGLDAFFQDVRCLFETIKVVLKKEGVVEGGTGTIIATSDYEDIRKFETISAEEVGFEDYGFKKTFSIDKSAQKKVLITGAGSYIGESIQNYILSNYPDIKCKSIDMVDKAWKEKSFEGFDTVFHVAGIAHVDVGHISPEEQEKYYFVNTDLAIEACRKAKADGVKQFIFMSSMIIYGDPAPIGKRKVIDEHTIPQPTSLYGDSKWQADKGVRKEATDQFKVVVLRPPMIYGKGCKGNYSLLSKMARKLPVFPKVINQRSMLYIENLCELVIQIILSGEGGIFFPQNSIYSNTSTLVEIIADNLWHPIRITGLLFPAVRIASYIPGKLSVLVNKAFGNMVYSQHLSTYDGLNYQIYGLKTSIERTEGNIEIERYH